MLLWQFVMELAVAGFHQEEMNEDVSTGVITVLDCKGLYITVHTIKSVLKCAV